MGRYLSPMVSMGLEGLRRVYEGKLGIMMVNFRAGTASYLGLILSLSFISLTNEALLTEVFPL